MFSFIIPRNVSSRLLFTVFTLVLAMSVLAVGCGRNPDDAGTTGVVQVVGSDTMVNLGQAWAESFMGDNTKAQIAVTGGGSGTGLAQLINGNADLALASRKIKAQEVEAIESKGLEVFEYVGARDALSVIVHPSNPIDSLTYDQIKAIFTGEITNWSQIGGADKVIVLHARESSSGTFAFFKEEVLEGESYATTALHQPSNQAIVQGVKQDEGGIGYVGLAYLNDDVKAVLVARQEGDTPTEPTVENASTGQYPLSRPLHIYAAGEPTGTAKQFIEFITGDAGQGIVAEVGFIPVR